MSSDIFDCHTFWEHVISFVIQWDGAKHFTMFRNTAHNKVLAPQMSIVLKLGNPGLEREQRGSTREEGRMRSRTNRFPWQLISVSS